MKIPRKASQMVRGSVFFLIVFNVIDVQRHPETVVWIGFFYNTCAVVFLLFNIALSHKPMIAIESFYRIHGHLRFILGLLFLTFVTTMKRGSSSLSKVCQEFVFFATTHVTCCQLRWFAFCHITGIVNTSL